MTLELVIPDVPPSLNVLLRLHWSARRRLQQAWTKHVWVARVEQGTTFDSCERAQVEVTRQSRKLLDTDNAYGACKVVLDALKANRLIEDDSPKHVSFTVTQELGIPQTRIRVTRKAICRDP